MNNKKGQIEIGVILTVFIGVLIGLTLIPAIGESTGLATTTFTATNASYTAPAASAIIDLEGQELIGTPIVYNASDITKVVDAGNYTIDEGISETTADKTVRYTSSALSEYAGLGLNISYTYGAEGYIDSSGGRALAGLIVIFACLAVAIIAMTPTLKSGVLNMVGK